MRLTAPLSILVYFLWSVQTAEAGAWLREEKEGFFALDIRLNEDSSATGNVRTEQGFYAEYGLRPNLTIGATGTYVPNESGEAQVFLRFPLNNKDQVSKLSAEFAIGAKTLDTVNFDPFLRTTLSWGRGLQMFGKTGWVNVDGSVQWAVGGNDSPHLFKLDATLGLNLTERVQIMGQTFFEADRFGDSLTIGPSVIYTFKSGKQSLVVGFEHRSGRQPRDVLRAGLWYRF